MTTERGSGQAGVDSGANQAFLPVSQPTLNGNERRYVLDCLDSTWISSNGSYLDRFEHEFAAFCGARHAMACVNGTVALHLALLALGVGPGDEVIVPSLTYVATANAVVYCGATPVMVDSEPLTWNLDPQKVAEAVTPRTKGIIVVHLFGHPADMGPIMQTAQQHELWVVEDAAEAHGATYKGQPVGGIGTLATFSFYGNKILTTGEGGMVTTNDPQLAEKVRLYKGQGQDPQRRYWFPVVGYNYRMTNICAALGLAQLEQAPQHIAKRRQIAGWYAQGLAGDRRFSLQPEAPWATNVYWMNSVLLAPDYPLDRDTVMGKLRERGIDSRPFFYPMHTLPMYAEANRGKPFPVAESVAARGLNVPTYGDLTEGDVARVVAALKTLA